MSTQIIRIRKANTQTNEWDVIYPETSSLAVNRPDGGLQEDYNLLYDNHIIDTDQHIYRATSTGTASTLSVWFPDVSLVDQLTLILKVHTELSTEPTLSYNGGEAKYIVATDGANISGGQVAGSSLVLIWSETLDAWVLANNDLDSNVTHVVLPVVSYYKYTATLDGENTIPITGYDRTSDKLTVNYKQTILQSGVDYTTLADNSIYLLNDLSLQADDVVFCTIEKYVETIRRGYLKFSLQTSNITVNIDTDDTVSVPVPEFGDNDYELVVNLNQTILREGVDYERDYGEKTLNLLDDRTFRAGDVIVFTISRYVEEQGTIGSYISSVGTYQTIVKPIYESFTADIDGTVRITVPSYDPYRDDLAVVLDNLVLVGDGVDYSITTSSEIVLLTHSLAAGDTIYFRIIKGVKIEASPYQTVNGDGDGTDILVSISEEALFDHMTLAIKLIAEIEDSPTLKFLEGPARSIVDSAGNPLVAGCIAQNAYLVVIYNADTELWYAINATANVASSTTADSGIALMSLSADESEVSTATVSSASSGTTLLASGEANFVGSIGNLLSGEEREINEVMIAHGLGYVPTNYKVIPCEPPANNTDINATVSIGDIWYYADENYLYVGNSGNATSKFKWFIYG